jgi:hypothetical protein
MKMTWNPQEAEAWLTKFALTLKSNGDVEGSNNLLYDILLQNVCRSEESFKQSLRDNTTLDETYIAWALKEVRHDG